jgi:TRAP-type C4-dicarboxylate transport system substrate-binding protein
MKKSVFCILILASFMCTLLAVLPLASASPVKLKAVCFLPKTHPMAAASVQWVDGVNKAFKGEIEVNYLGGPEITAPQEQLQALKNGVFDINFNVTSYYAPYAPELNAFQLSKLMPWEERKPGGFYDYMADRHRKIGVVYLGRYMYGPFYVWTKAPVTKLDDLKGLKLRVGPMYIYFMNKLGVSTVSISPTDVYTALERGTVDGFAWPLLGAREMGWTDSCKYLIDHPFYGMDGAILFNMDSWNKIPKATQDKLLEFTAKFERDMVNYFESEYAKERMLLKKAGVKFVKFSEPEAREYLKKAYDAYWEVLEKKVPDLVPDLKRVTGN